MEIAILTISSALLMIVSLIYLIIYFKKRKIDSHKEYGYKIIFTTLIILLSMPIIYQLFT